MRHLLRFKAFNKKLCEFRKNCANLNRGLCTQKKTIKVLGIESSCDDTGFAIVDSSGNILGEAINSQMQFHLKQGGINPLEARLLHEKNIQKVYEECLTSANFVMDNVDAIAVSVEPGLPMSLTIGRDFALKLSKEYDKPVIPIHHMKAHALTVRMIKNVEFPYLAFLVSGGHCILALVQSVNDFKILGQALDNAPGEAMDKVARRLKLSNIPEYANVCGGQALEMAARKADNPEQFFFPAALAHYRDCNFSFSGLKTKAQKHILQQERDFNVMGADIIPDVNNLCAGFLMAYFRHMCMRVQRAMEFIEKNELIPEEQRTLVVSGGVASNNILAKALSKVCEEIGFKFIRPPPKLCTDNGVMIAWNGVEKFAVDLDVVRNRNDIEKIDIKHKSPIGDDWTDIVTKEGIKRKWVKLKFNELID
ncbi:hypothetical protein TKK_0007898 [Trichogramma kaykai]|uniref:N(6)-L-threonylcarbamoyladenine synthase n=1 Tax=Trichogramma kaykai TaxID=54128 RepID=A0ABD2X8S2_9HYME